MSQRTAQLLETLRAWCHGERGRQTMVSKILSLKPSTVSDWMSGRRQFTGEQALALTDFLRTVYGNPAAEAALASNPTDPLEKLHASLENPDRKTVWIRTLGEYHHVILGGRERDKALARLLELIKKDRK